MKEKLARQRGLPLPEPEPEEQSEEDELHHSILWIWQAFAMLSRTRLVNEAGPQPITLSEISNYCFLEGIIDAAQRRDILYHVSILDIEWCKVTHERIANRREEDRKKAEQDAKRKAKGRR